MKRANIAILGVVLTVFAVGWASGLAKETLAQTPIVRPTNPLVELLRQRFNPKPNLLVEDHVEISCEPRFSVKVLTAVPLLRTSFTVEDAATETVLFGPFEAGQLNPLWQKVWLGPLSAIPPKINVVMTAVTADGKTVNHTLIVEPDCQKSARSVTNQIIVIHPVGKVLVNPEPPEGPDGEIPQVRIPLPPLIMTVPSEAIGQTATVVVRLPDGTPVGGGLETIDTEILSMQLTGGGISIPLQPTSPLEPEFQIHSFFDVFYEIQLGDGEPFNHPVRLIDATPLENGTLQNQAGHDSGSLLQ